MSVFDDAYDEMSWEEVCCRLPGNLAVNAIKRRVNNLDTVRILFENAGRNSYNIGDIRDLVNNILSKESVAKILSVFGGSDIQRTLHSWLNEDNIERLRGYKSENLDIKLLFNITKSDDQDGLIHILKRILSEDNPLVSQIRSVFRKADNSCIPPLVDMIIKDTRDSVRSTLLCLPLLYDSDFVSDHYKTMALKSMVRCDCDFVSINTMSVNVFKNLRPEERLDALEKYLSFFPLYRKSNVFDPSISEDEFKVILFSGCIKYYDRTQRINSLYEKITKLDEPDELKDE